METQIDLLKGRKKVFNGFESKEVGNLKNCKSRHKEKEILKT